MQCEVALADLMKTLEQLKAHRIHDFAFQDVDETAPPMAHFPLRNEVLDEGFVNIQIKSEPFSKMFSDSFQF